MLDSRLGVGSHAFHGPWGTSIAPNITSHADGLVGYSGAELKQMITTTEWHSYDAATRDDDIDTIILYQRSLPHLPDPG